MAGTLLGFDKAEKFHSEELKKLPNHPSTKEPKLRPAWRQGGMRSRKAIQLRLVAAHLSYPGRYPRNHRKATQEAGPGSWISGAPQHRRPPPFVIFHLFDTAYLLRGIPSTHCPPSPWDWMHVSDPRRARPR